MQSLIPWRAKDGWLEQLRKEMDETMERFFGSVEPVGKGAMAVWAPQVDIEETDKQLVVKADLPGVDPKNVEVAVRDDILTLSGEKKEEREEKKKNYHRVERFVGRFYREIPLPSGVETDKITAESSKGVVTISIPKKPEAQPKKISVKAHE